MAQTRRPARATPTTDPDTPTPGNDDGDFTTEVVAEDLKPQSFRVDGEEFFVCAVIPADAMRLVSAFVGGGNASWVQAGVEFMEAVLLDESAERYAARLKSKERPITITDLAKHAQHLMRNVYGVTRPLEKQRS